jgi:hypothetical protein
MEENISAFDKKLEMLESSELPRGKTPWPSLIPYGKYIKNDYWAWFMFILGMLLISVNLGGFGMTPNYVLAAAVFFFFIEYPIRLYNGCTIQRVIDMKQREHKCYEILINGDDTIYHKV